MIVELSTNFELILLLLGVGFFGGIIEATAGGSGLITLPTLLMLGFPPINALATSKFQYAFGAIVAIWRFLKAGLVDWRSAFVMLLPAFIFGATGAYLLTFVDSELFAIIIPFFLILISIYFFLSPNFSDQDRKPLISSLKIALFIIPIIALYDGFIGIGSASLYMMIFVTLRGLNVRQATAITKLVDFTSGSAALVVLAYQGYVLLFPGLILAAGQILGAYIGAGLVLKLGARWVRPIIVLVTIALSLQILIKG